MEKTIKIQPLDMARDEEKIIRLSREDQIELALALIENKTEEITPSMREAVKLYKDVICG